MKQIISEAFLQFVETLMKNDLTPEISGQALTPISNYLGIGRVYLVLNVAPNQYTPKGESNTLIGYMAEQGFNKNQVFQKVYINGEGGVCHIFINPVLSREEWTLEEKNALIAIADILILHCARFRLIGKVRENSLRNYLTGLPNSGGYIQEIVRHFQEGNLQRYNSIQFNLQRFSLINSEFGSKEGDAVIQRYAAIMCNAVTEDEVIGHFGGDNFTALIRNENINEFLNLISSVKTYAVKNGKTIPVEIHATVGIMPISQPLKEPVDAISGASAALSFAKRNKLTRVFMNEQMIQRITYEKKIEAMFPAALRNEEFHVFYQPKVDTDTGKIIGAEALVRWFTREKILSPGEFIPLLELNGHVLDLDLYILEHVCADMKAWKNLGMTLVPFSANFSRRDFSGSNGTVEALVAQIKKIIDQYDINYENIIIEVTETNDADDQIQLYDLLKRLNEIGLTTSIDDFGTGYSSLSILRDYPIDEIKIDRSFINHAKLMDNDRIIIKSIISMAYELGIRVIAEGIETWEQVDFLRKLGCTHVQGYLYDKPIPKIEFEKRIRDGGYFNYRI